MFKYVNISNQINPKDTFLIQSLLNIFGFKLTLIQNDIIQDWNKTEQLRIYF